MLEVLRRLIQDVNAADSLEDALALIVAQVRAAMHTDVCTIYLHDKASQKLVFRATEGLNSEKVGQFGFIMAELTFKIFRFNTTYAFVKSSNVKQQIYNEKLGYQLINENKKEQKLTYALTSKNYKLKGTKILRAIGIVTSDHSEISWSDIDFSKVNPDTYTKQYTNLPSDIQTMIDQYILKFK